MPIKFHNEIDLKVNELLKEEKKEPVCHAGCSVCCEYTNIFATHEEIPAIVRAINKLDFKIRKNIAKNIKEIDSKWKGAGSLHAAQPEEFTQRDFNHMDQVMSNKYRCPLLIGGKCIIYEDRPAVCRTYFSSDAQLCKSENADMNFSKKIGFGNNIVHSETEAVILPMALFRNIDFISNKFHYLAKSLKAKKI